MTGPDFQRAKCLFLWKVIYISEEFNDISLSFPSQKRCCCSSFFTGADKCICGSRSAKFIYIWGGAFKRAAVTGRWLALEREVQMYEKRLGMEGVLLAQMSGRLNAFLKHSFFSDLFLQRTNLPHHAAALGWNGGVCFQSERAVCALLPTLFCWHFLAASVLSPVWFAVSSLTGPLWGPAPRWRDSHPGSSVPNACALNKQQRGEDLVLFQPSILPSTWKWQHDPLK